MEKKINCYFCDKQIEAKESNNSHFIKGRICNECNDKIEIPLRFLSFQNHKNVIELIELYDNFINSITKFFKENKGQLNKKKYKEFLDNMYNKVSDK